MHVHLGLSYSKENYGKNNFMTRWMLFNSKVHGENSSRQIVTQLEVNLPQIRGFNRA